MRFALGRLLTIIWNPTVNADATAVLFLVAKEDKFPTIGASEITKPEGKRITKSESSPLKTDHIDVESTGPYTMKDPVRSVHDSCSISILLSFAEVSCKRRELMCL